MEMNILYAHIQPFGEMLQHKHLPTIRYGDGHAVYFISSTKCCNATYFCTQSGMETYALCARIRCTTKHYNIDCFTELFMR